MEQARRRSRTPAALHDSVCCERPVNASHEFPLSFMARILRPFFKKNGLVVRADGVLDVGSRQESPMPDEAPALLSSVQACPGAEVAQAAAFRLLSLANGTPANVEAIVVAGGLSIALSALHQLRPGAAAPWAWVGASALVLRLLEQSPAARAGCRSALAAAGFTLESQLAACVSTDAEGATYATRLLAAVAFDADAGVSLHALDAAWGAPLCPVLLTRLTDVGADNPCPPLAVASSLLVGALAAWGTPVILDWIRRPEVIAALGATLTAEGLLPIRRAAAAAALEAMYARGRPRGAGAALFQGSGCSVLAGLLQQGTPFGADACERALVGAARDPTWSPRAASAARDALARHGESASPGLQAACAAVLRAADKLASKAAAGGQRTDNNADGNGEVGKSSKGRRPAHAAFAFAPPFVFDVQPSALFGIQGGRKAPADAITWVAAVPRWWRADGGESSPRSHFELCDNPKSDSDCKGDSRKGDAALGCSMGGFRAVR